MSVFRRSGLVHKRTAYFQLLYDQVKAVDLKPVSRIQYKFDPFGENTKEIRNFMFYLSAPRIRDSNIKCSFKTEVVCDLSEPTVVCKLVDGKTLTFKTENLTAYEILKEFNRIVLPLVPPPQDTPVAATKSQSQRKK